MGRHYIIINIVNTQDPSRRLPSNLKGYNSQAQSRERGWRVSRAITASMDRDLCQCHSPPRRRYNLPVHLAPNIIVCPLKLLFKNHYSKLVFLYSKVYGVFRGKMLCDEQVIKCRPFYLNCMPFFVILERMIHIHTAEAFYFLGYFIICVTSTLALNNFKSIVFLNGVSRKAPGWPLAVKSFRS